MYSRLRLLSVVTISAFAVAACSSDAALGADVNGTAARIAVIPHLPGDDCR